MLSLDPEIRWIEEFRNHETGGSDSAGAAAPRLLGSMARMLEAQQGRRVSLSASTLQALLDAMALREMLFCVLPGIRSAEFRAFRQSAREPPRVVIAGTVTREAPAVLRVPSPAMRAKLYGFHFCLDDGVLRPQFSEIAP